MVVVPLASAGRFMSVATPPVVSANAIALPPWIAWPRVQRSGRTTILAITLSASACVNVIPINWANGSGRELMFSSRFMDLPLPKAIPALLQAGMRQRCGHGNNLVARPAGPLIGLHHWKQRTFSSKQLRRQHDGGD